MNNLVHHACMDTVINTWLIATGLDIQAAGQQIGLCVESYRNHRASRSFSDALGAGLRIGAPSLDSAANQNRSAGS